MGLLDLIFPKSCLGCKKEGQYICPDCLEKVHLLSPVCPYCERASIDGFTHTKCQKKRGLDGLTSVWKYEGIIKKAIWALKFKYATEIVQEICGYYADKVKGMTLPGNMVLVPIPIFWYRENVRGFNQSVLLGKMVADKMDWKFVPDLLVKKRPTASQVELSVMERKQNLRGVFSLNPNYVLSTEYSVLLFDDVFTTGSTLKEAAKILKRAGVKKVWGMTIAR